MSLVDQVIERLWAFGPGSGRVCVQSTRHSHLHMRCHVMMTGARVGGGHSALGVSKAVIALRYIMLRKFGFFCDTFHLRRCIGLPLAEVDGINVVFFQ